MNRLWQEQDERAWADDGLEQQYEYYRAGGPPLQDHDKELNMKLNDMIESKYLKKEDLGGEDVPCTVQKLTKVNLARDDEEPKYKWTVKFAEFPKAMVLNATNLKRMFKYLGDDSDDWTGNQVIVYFDPEVSFGSDVVGGLRVRQLTRPSAKPRSRSIEDANKELADATDNDPPF